LGNFQNGFREGSAGLPGILRKPCLLIT